MATFTALLIARSCFSLEDVIYHVALPSLLAALPSGEWPHAVLPLQTVVPWLCLVDYSFKGNSSLQTLFGLVMQSFLPYGGRVGGRLTRPQGICLEDLENSGLLIVNSYIIRCWESRRWAWCKVNMSPVAEASGRVHRPHVPWSLLSTEIFIQDISWPSLVVCCTWEYSYWCCVSSIEGHAQAFWSRYVCICLQQRTVFVFLFVSPVVTCTCSFVKLIVDVKLKLLNIWWQNGCSETWWWGWGLYSG